MTLYLLLALLFGAQMATHDPKVLKQRIFHVPHGVAYAIENSVFGTRLARILGWPWIDKDFHVTKDGVVVNGHWPLISRDRFILPKWFIAKYGKKAKIENVLWEDLKRLRTEKLSWRGKSYIVGYSTLEEVMRQCKRNGRRLSMETKGGPAFAKTETWDGIEATRAKVGLPKSHFQMMCLSTMDHAFGSFKAAHGRVRTVLLPRGPVPASWKPYIDFYRGSKPVWK